jgi:3-hydroxyisobutyrate dehydrogenase
MTSSSPAAGRELVAAAWARGIGVLDAPVGGGVTAARLGRRRYSWAAMRRSWTGAVRCWKRSPTRSASSASAATRTGYTAKLLVNLLWFGQAVDTGEALPVARRAGIDLDVLRQALAASAASTAFARDDLGALIDGDYLTSFGPDRCCEELTPVAELARELRVPSQLTQVVEQTRQRALRRFGPVDGELLAVALLEEEAGLRLRHGPA